MVPATTFGILFALAAALSWGGADFSGGFATRRSSQYQVLAVAAFSGIITLGATALLFREGPPSWRSIAWAGAAGASGAFGLAALYLALSLRQAASVAPTAAVVGAALPVAYTSLVEGTPGAQHLAGFGLAFVGIWLVSSTASHATDKRRGLLLAWFSGVCFGGFFIFLGQMDPGDVFTPLIFARLATLLTAFLLLIAARQPFHLPTTSPHAWLAGILDAAGNAFYVLAKQFTRLDIAVVLGSLYPALTVLLSALILKERVTPVQWVGVWICLGAILLITL